MTVIKRSLAWKCVLLKQPDVLMVRSKHTRLFDGNVSCWSSLILNAAQLTLRLFSLWDMILVLSRQTIKLTSQGPILKSKISRLSKGYITLNESKTLRRDSETNDIGVNIWNRNYCFSFLIKREEVRMFVDFLTDKKNLCQLHDSQVSDTIDKVTCQ